MAMLDDAKKALRITSTAYDGEVIDLISAAESDLALSGITKIDEMDPLIKRAVIVYCKANFGFDNPEAERLQQSFDMLKTSLSLAGDYNA